MSQGVKVPDALILEALGRSRGMIAVAAREIGMSRQNLTRRISRSKKLKAFVEDQREYFLDRAELSLINEVRAGTAWAVIWTLKTLGKSRGYIERVEHTGQEGRPIEVSHSVKEEAAQFMQRMNKLIEDKGEIIDIQVNGSVNGDGGPDES